MSDWQLGDLALCVDSQAHPYLGATRLIEGVVYHVIKVWPGGEGHAIYGVAEAGLELAEVRSESPLGFAGNRFRKIRPDEHKACEPEFVQLLKRLDPEQPFPLHFPKVPNEHAWLIEAATLVRKWRDEDLREGVVWDAAQSKGGDR